MDAEREAIRAKANARPGWYWPWGHLAVPSLVGLCTIAACARALGPLRWWDGAFAAAVFVLANAVEWRAHRDLLHKRWPPLGVLYDRHTPLHHRVFIAGDMQMRDAREFRMVLLPAFGILAILVASVPPAALLWLFGQKNLGLIYLGVSVGYVVMYEWLHLAYHLPERWLIGPLGIVRRLRRHHETHHDPRLMQSFNFNVTLPLWDHVRGTVAPR